MHFYGWKKGLKTGMYYLRTMAASAPIQFTVDQTALKLEMGKATKRLVRKPYKPVTSLGQVPSSRPSATDLDKTTSKLQNSHISSSASVTSASPAFNSLGSSTEKPASKEEKVAAEVDKVDADKTQTESEFDIYNSKVLACSIQNPEACEMCSG